jgi:hypothetical protein
VSESTSSATGPMSSARLEQFESEVSQMKVTGGGANPERLGSRWGAVLMGIALGGAFLSWQQAYNATNFETIQRAISLGIVFAIVGIIGAVLWLRNSLSRYLRFWLIRQVYEQREQTDRLIEALRERS